MNTNNEIMSGDFWSTKSSSSIPGMLVLVDCPYNGTLLGYPMFCESVQATGECFHLEGHPEFNDLLDERWVNFACPVKLDTKALYAKLGHSQYALECLHAFEKGVNIPLDNGVPMIKGIGDAREKFQTELFGNLKKLAGASLLDLTMDALKHTLTSKVALSVSDYLRRGLNDIPFLKDRQANYGPGNFMRGAAMTRCFAAKLPLTSCFDSCLASRQEENDAKGLVLNINGKNVLFQMEAHGSIAHFIFSGSGISKIELCMAGSDEWQEVPVVTTGIFMTRPARLSSFKAQFYFDDGDVEIIDLNVTND